MCENCQDKIKSRGFGLFECKGCRKNVMCEHYPMNNYCSKCSDNICEMCGKPND